MCTLSQQLTAKARYDVIAALIIRSTGFVLEGFPRNVDEAEYMAANGLYPDCAVILVVEDTDVISRLLPPKLEKWKQKRDKKLAKRQKIKDKAKKKRVRVLDERLLNTVSQSAMTFVCG